MCEKYYLGQASVSTAVQAVSVQVIFESPVWIKHPFTAGRVNDTG